MTAKGVEEIRSVIQRVRRRGEFEILSSETADREADRVGALIRAAHELTDEEADVILSGGVEVPSVSDDRLQQEVVEAVRRAQSKLSQEGRGSKSERKT